MTALAYLWLQGPTVPPFRLAAEVFNAAADKLQRSVCQYFTDVIVQHGDEMDEDRDHDAVKSAHTLIKRMHEWCPNVLLNVIPLIEEEMRVDDLQVRLLATETLGAMYAHSHGSDLAKKYPATWTTWSARKNDKSPVVRIAFVEAARGLVSNSDLKVDITG